MKLVTQINHVWRWDLIQDLTHTSQRLGIQLHAVDWFLPHLLCKSDFNHVFWSSYNGTKGILFRFQVGIWFFFQVINPKHKNAMCNKNSCLLSAKKSKVRKARWLKFVCQHAWGLEFDLWNTYSGRREPAPASCLLTSLHITSPTNKYTNR